jgi:prevent-host-death family protein
MKAVKKISALHARKNLGQLLEAVYYQGTQYVIERAGRPMAAVVPLRQLAVWKDQEVKSKRLRREGAAGKTTRSKSPDKRA